MAQSERCSFMWPRAFRAVELLCCGIKMNFSLGNGGFLDQLRWEQIELLYQPLQKAITAPFGPSSTSSDDIQAIYDLSPSNNVASETGHVATFCFIFLSEDCQTIADTCYYETWLFSILTQSMYSKSTPTSPIWILPPMCQLQILS